MNLVEYIGAYGTHESVLRSWDTRGRKGSESFVSPSTEENLTFQDAMQRLLASTKKPVKFVDDTTKGGFICFVGGKHKP
jgi:hypothetical protein